MACYFESEIDVSDNVSIQLTYYKWFTQMTNINRNKIFEDTDDNDDIDDLYRRLYRRKWSSLRR